MYQSQQMLNNQLEEGSNISHSKENDNSIPQRNRTSVPQKTEFVLIIEMEFKYRSWGSEPKLNIMH